MIYPGIAPMESPKNHAGPANIPTSGMFRLCHRKQAPEAMRL